MKIKNASQYSISISKPSLTLGAGQVAEVNTLEAFSSAELQSLINKNIILVISVSSSGGSPFDTFLDNESGEGTLSPGDSAALTGGGDTTLHYHSADRARAGHTGTQLKATISDFAHGASSHTGAIGTLSQISDVTITVGNLNILDDGVNTTLHFHDSDRNRANHTGTQTKSTISDFAHGASDHTGAIGTLSQISDVTITVSDLNSLDDGVNSTLHFHDSDRNRTNHTGTQTKSTVSDFAHGASDHTGVIGTLSQISDVTITVSNLNSLDDGVDSTLHFHNSDRARGNHTGTQTKSTISDFTHGASDHTGAIGTLSQISDITVAAGNINAYLPTVGTTAARPTTADVAVGHMYFDQDLNRPIFSDGSIWRYSDGTAV